MHLLLVLGLFGVAVQAIMLPPIPRSNIVTTTYGPVRGFSTPINSTNPLKQSARVFLGIPFAKPPVGALRFEKPQPPQPWTAVRNADAFAASCYPVTSALMLDSSKMNYSEDCLYLNVITPAFLNKHRPVPVMVYIHGGGFIFGSATDYGYEYFAQNYVSRDVIIVTIQYRLAQFGFLNIKNTDMKGNYGLWDQVQALKFVKKNIALFGGDPNRITIFGHSAGGASVGHLTASPRADGLYNNAIQLSGSPFAEWATSNRNNASIAIAELFGCSGNQPKACLKSKTTEELLGATNHVGYYRPDALNFFLFAPTIDGDFHPDTISKLIRRAGSPKRPTLLGVADGEGIEFTVGAAFSPLNNLYIPPDQYANFTKDSFKDTITRLIANAANVGSSSAAQQLLDRIVTFYIDQAAQHAPPVIYGNVSNVVDGPFYVGQYSKVVTDLMFLVPALVDARIKTGAGWPTYLYRYGYLNMDTVLEPNRPVYVVCAHAGEYPYLFNVYYDRQPVPLTENDVKFRDHFLDTLTQFAKTNKPNSPSATVWPKLTAGNLATFPHVEIAPKMVQRNNVGLFTKSLAFWRNIRSNFNFSDILWFPAA